METEGAGRGRESVSSPSRASLQPPQDSCSRKAPDGRSSAHAAVRSGARPRHPLSAPQSRVRAAPSVRRGRRGHFVWGAGPGRGAQGWLHQAPVPRRPPSPEISRPRPLSASPAAPPTPRRHGSGGDPAAAPSPYPAPQWHAQPLPHPGPRLPLPRRAALFRPNKGASGRRGARRAPDRRARPEGQGRRRRSQSGFCATPPGLLRWPKPPPPATQARPHCPRRPRLRRDREAGASGNQPPTRSPANPSVRLPAASPTVRPQGRSPAPSC